MNRGDRREPIFRDDEDRQQVISTLGVLLNVQVYWLAINVYLANFISIVLVSLWNFFLLNLKRCSPG
ncbi:MAG: hypothetical protein DME19_02505 [Verrucomicrobia bacterium]|nr:MAG: hypothetical protein DME19_02505 [Verrucomicrobiota bacterium]